MDKILEKVGDKIAQEVGLTELDEEDYFLPINDLGLDSLAFQLLLLWIESEYKLSIPVDDLTQDNFGTPRSIASYIASKVTNP